MKIRPNVSELQGDVVKLDVHDRLKKKAGTSDGATNQAAPQADATKISTLGAALSQQLNPSILAEERRTKIENIKAQIANGTYNPPLTDVAQALAQEISEEILSVGGFSDD